ncbi:MAG: FG-GAP repeat domain-containing protein [Aequoribacter sp.]|uniref:FG-GAP repeat domain-containing protein n=1 Tax=Aequoribacter sp. TaxID=2847771 RepID=UPI003C3A159D
MQRTIKKSRAFAGALALINSVATYVAADEDGVVAKTMANATGSGYFMSWREHRIDDEGINGGEPIRGGDGLAMADFDKDGQLDIVSVHEDSHHLRIAFNKGTADTWLNITIAQGATVGAIEDVALGDINGDGWIDMVVACEDAHLAYFQNPGPQARSQLWPHLILSATRNRGSWIQTALADLNGDGQLEILGANKGHADVVDAKDTQTTDRTTSAFYLRGDPLKDESWQEQILFAGGVPNQAIPVDIDNDDDIDVLVAKRVQHQMYIIENLGTDDNGHMQHRSIPIQILASFDTPEHWQGRSQAFNAEFADIDNDGHLDLITNVLEFEGSRQWSHAGLGWLKQPEDLTQSWLYTRIGNTLPDWIIGVGIGDIDGDGDIDAITGGYSGLNIVKGGYSGDSRTQDDPRVTRNSSVARIAWFENPGDLSKSWIRHDVSRRVRGMYDQYISHDLDDDGDIDLIATRGNSGEYDGVFWLEQIRTTQPVPIFTPSRTTDSQQLPLPSPDWRKHYTDRFSTVPSNKKEQIEALKGR